jgi:hypothetical protein
MLASFAMLDASAPCIPVWIHALYAERVRAKAAGVLDEPMGYTAGCQLTDEGIVNCDPESMRSRAEARIKALGLYPRNRTLSLDAYSIARNIRSEAGDGRAAIPIKVVYAEAALTRAALGDKTITQLTMRDGKHYGKQRGSNPSVSSRTDPNWEDIVIAEMAIAGAFHSFGRGTTHYFSPRIMDAWHAKGKGKDALATFETWSHGWSSDREGLIWVGELPGIDHREHFLMRWVPLKSQEWKDGYALGKKMITRASTTAHAPACAAEEAAVYKRLSTMGFIGRVLIAGFFGATAGLFLSKYGQEVASSRKQLPRRI